MEPPQIVSEEVVTPLSHNLVTGSRLLDDLPVLQSLNDLALEYLDDDPVFTGAGKQNLEKVKTSLNGLTVESDTELTNGDLNLESSKFFVEVSRWKFSRARIKNLGRG
jgi:hypothetical protein